MNKILFPTDLSEAANHAFIYALQLADKMNAQIIALHVYDVPVIKGTGLPHTLQEFYSNIEKEEFENFEDNLPLLLDIARKNGLDHIPLSSMLKRSHDTVKTIIETADEEQVDFITMGTKGATGLREIIFGSVAGEVLENANCPVLSIPEEAEFDGNLDAIAVTTEYKEEELKAIQRVLEVAGLFGAKVYVINVDTARTEFYLNRMDELREQFEDNDNIDFFVLEGSNIREVVSTFLEDYQIELLAMVTHKRTFFQELFNYSHGKEMAYHLKTPVLSIQAHTLSA